MQNEERINGLETQVRTLKRVVYGFGCLFVAGIVVGATSGCSDSPTANDNKDKIQIAKMKAETIAKTVNLYILDTGLSIPSDDFDLEILLLSPDEGGGPYGPYFEQTDDIIDPWGNPYTITTPGNINARFDIISYGEDGLLGGTGNNADITQ